MTARFLSARFPRFQESIKRGVVSADVFTGVVTQALGDDLAVRAQVLNALIDDGDVDAVDGHFSAALVFVGVFDMNLCPWGREINGFSGQNVADWCVTRFRRPHSKYRRPGRPL